MTIPADKFIDLVSVLHVIKDKESLQLTQRVIAGNRLILEAHLAQMKELEAAIGDRLKGLGK